MLKPLVTEIEVFFSQNIQLVQETRPMQFVVIQQTDEEERRNKARP